MNKLTLTIDNQIFQVEVIRPATRLAERGANELVYLHNTRRAHLYYCGSAGMLEAFRRSADVAGVSADRVHFEYFGSNVENATEGGFTVVLAKTGIELAVSPARRSSTPSTMRAATCPSPARRGFAARARDA